MKIYENESIESKLFRLKEIIKILEELSRSPKDKFVKEFQLNNLAMFNLLIGITIILDVGQHLLGKISGKTAEEYKEIVRMLGQEGIVPAKFAEANIDMAKFRNLMVHDYDKIDEAMVHDYLQKAPDVFREFAEYFVEFMDKYADDEGV
ncbi:DUF86 domain-containing protein [Patescibacteria group bacterium]|nr:DUF86 domain-containing protein [Patescibacteria group bacterium]